MNYKKEDVNMTEVMTPMASQQLPEALQQQVDEFERKAAEYKDLQARFTQTIQEIERLENSAAALESQAQAVDQEWKGIAVGYNPDQRKINTLIAKNTELKTQAEALRLTAQARTEIKREMVVQLATLRRNLNSYPKNVNSQHRNLRLQEILSNEAFKQTLIEAFTIIRANQIEEYRDDLGTARLDLNDPNSIERDITRTFGNEIKKILNSEQAEEQPQYLIVLPKPVSQEIIAYSPGSLRILRKNNGVIPTSPWEPNGPKGLKVVH